MKNTVLGIDISKKELYYSDSSGETSGIILNDNKGFRKLVSIFKKGGFKMMAMEATGGYERNLLLYLHQRDLPAALLEPSRVRNHAKGAGFLAKTDKIDAVMIAHFTQCHDPRLVQMPSKLHRELRELNHRRGQLVKMTVMEKTRLEKLSIGR